MQSSAHRRQPSTGSSSSSVNGRKVQRTYTSSSLYGRRLTADAVSRSSSTRSRDSGASSSSSEPQRAALAPVQASRTLRHPSRLRAQAIHNFVNPISNGVPGLEGIMVGGKRKRAVSGSENLSTGRFSDAPRMKRQRSEASSQVSSDDGGDQPPASEMDVDEASPRSMPSPGESDDEIDPSDQHWLYEAEARHLRRLRKEKLIRLYQSIGLTDDPELLNKATLSQAIVDAREDDATLPPSSPPRDNASEYSSDNDDIVDDESPTRPSPRDVIRRNFTAIQFGSDMSMSRRHQPRNASMGTLPTLASPQASSSKPSPRVNAIIAPFRPRRRTTSTQSADPTASLPSPPATRRRSSRMSVQSTSSDATTSTSTRKGKGKRVGFAEAISVTPSTCSTNSSRSSAYRADGEGSSEDLSDLTDLTDSDNEANAQATPRPKQRSRPSGDHASRRKTPARKAKAKVGNLREESDVSTDEELEKLASDESSPSPPPASPVKTPRPTPIKNRLRYRAGGQTLTPPSDGDDEGDEEAEEEQEPTPTIDEDTEIGEEDVSTEVEVTPKRLRSGKVVGEDVDIASGDEDDEDEVEDQIIEDNTEDDITAIAADVPEEEVDIGAEDEDEGDSEETTENVDLATVTPKLLKRCKRDELVRMCEARELPVEGNKSQLVDTLIKWRNHQPPPTAPSSTGTVRPTSAVRAASPGRRRSNRTSRGDKTPVPILLRTHVHVHQPNTPPVSGPTTAKPGTKEGEDGEVELDLVGLGLVDREIPCDRITKLEKIGSGGFKDVFIGKFKGKKVAIAEFRGTLTQMDIKELKLLGEFAHPNIVRFIGVSIPENTKETPVMIVSELCTNGDLFDYVRNVPPPKLSKVLSLMLDIAKGLFYLHERKPSVIHRDCKSSNILITGRVTAKIADFGLAKVKQSTRSMVRSLVGTVNWQAPELWSPSPKYNHKVDVFSCAMVFWEMLQWHLPDKTYPWEGMNEHAIYDAVGAKRQRPTVAGLETQWCPEIVELMQRMWAQDAADRPDMKDVVIEVERLVKKYK